MAVFYKRNGDTRIDSQVETMTRLDPVDLGLLYSSSGFFPIQTEQGLTRNNSLSQKAYSVRLAGNKLT
jgi:hypothetical protein